MALILRQISYGGWPNCLLLTNETIELIVTLDVGPRIIRCGFHDEDNLFKEYREQLGTTGGDDWRIYGGHRLWHAPEIKPRTYSPDNAAVPHQWDGLTLTLVQDTEPLTHIGKHLTIKMSADRNEIAVTHELINNGPWAITTAPWCLTVLAPGGRAVLPQERFIPFPDALLPARPLVLWHYTDMADSRFTFSTNFIELRQDSNAQNPQKLGIRNSCGWGLYEKNGTVFLKRAALIPDAIYPDFNSNWELYTNHEMLELETLGPLTHLEPGSKVTHEEIWSLHKTQSNLESSKLIKVLGLSC